MITHITVEDAAKLISRLTNANETQALTYIREAADRGEIQAADALTELQAELNAAKSPEVLEAVDELIEFARTRMGIAEWLYYVDVLGEWRGQKEN